MRGERYIYDVDRVDGDQAWALFEACREDDAAAVRALLDSDVNLVHAQNWYTQPIHFATYSNRPEIVRILLEAGAEPGRSRFMYGGWDGLLDRAAELGFEECHGILCAALEERFGFQPEFERLEQAIRARDGARVAQVLAERPDLAGATDVSGNGAVHWAVMTRQPELLQPFIDHGADPDHCRSDGQTAAHVALNGDYAYRVWRELRDVKVPDAVTVVRRLLDCGADYDLSIACGLGDFARVETLLRSDPDRAVRLDSGRRSPLMYGARAGHLEIVLALLENGADPNRPEELAEDGAALFEACAGGHGDIVELLLERGANPNASSDSSGDCVHIAQLRAGDESEWIVDLLRRQGATVSLWDLSVADMTEALEKDLPVSRDFDFALEALTRNDLALARLLLDRRPELVGELHGGSLRLGDPDASVTESAVLRLLLDSGFDPNRPDWLGKTALHHYSQRGDVGNTLLLIERGADIDVVDDQFHGTPLAWAVRSQQKGTVQLLLDHGADPDLPVEPLQARPLACARALGHEEIAALLAGEA